MSDAICSSLSVDEYMIRASDDSKAYWEAFGVLPPPMYYGNDDSVFRMYPGMYASDILYVCCQLHL